MANHFTTKQLINIIGLYQRYLSVYLPPSCRFYPSCSAYAIEALQYHGLLNGIMLTLKRLLRCHPFCCGGYDPVVKKPS